MKSAHFPISILNGTELKNVISKRIETAKRKKEKKIDQLIHPETVLSSWIYLKYFTLLRKITFFPWETRRSPRNILSSNFFPAFSLTCTCGITWGKGGDSDVYTRMSACVRVCEHSIQWKYHVPNSKLEWIYLCYAKRGSHI